MTDNRTIELREKLAERGVEYTTRDGMKATSITHITHWYADGVDAEFTEQIKGCTRLTASGLTPEQAIAATLGSGTLTAEQVREAIERHVKFYEGGDYDEQAIADELNAALGGGECGVESKIFTEGEYVPCPYYEYEMECGGRFRWDDVEPPNFCPSCGKAVKR